MAKIPVRFKRVAAAFDEVARIRPCESSGSEYSPEGDLADLSDLIDSFMETDYYRVERVQLEDDDDRKDFEKSSLDDAESFWSDSEAKEMLPSLLEELKQVVRLMCAAARKSLKRMEMHVPPWRRNGYMQAKWFGRYKRTTRATAALRNSPVVAGENLREKRSVGFVALPEIYSYCRGVSDRKMGLNLKAGKLAAVFNGMEL
ncbi:hypothetical protein NE237_033211 [Protea cynaroides]|uniref:Uncharacterized protein n=1 Tax=Protea cynaroides TaxID=273540 RepID=A0A9Q0L675_9MAGN|nr:hypothetical protein NE237_033211 [Protea cynaroides]